MRAASDWQSAADLIRSGTAPEAIRCSCGGQWDGTTPGARPCCVGCRAAICAELLAGIHIVVRDIEEVRRVG